MRFLYLFVSFLLISSTLGAVADDLVDSLPGLDDEINFDHYSGYLDATEGRHLHYWFMESKSDPANDPLLLWLNGGPGCSSLEGLLTENGPFYVVDDGDSLSLELRPYSWNNEANVLFLESPACVGYSYDDDERCRSNDTSTSLQNYLALQSFFTKFPEYSKNEFFVTGESYAGFYIPLLVLRIISGQSTYPINLQGYAIGNGITGYVANTDSLMFFSHYHTIIGTDLWRTMITNCCVDGVESASGCTFLLSLDPICQTAVMEATLKTYYGGLNMYNLLGECEEAPSGQMSREYFDRENVYGQILDRDIDLSNPPCINSELETNYLNQPDVREALHIPDSVGSWAVCSRLLFGRQVFNSVKYLKKIVDHNVRGLLYSGDVDMAVNYIGSERSVTEMGLRINEMQRAWWSNGQVGGHVTRYPYLDFLTVRGAGHMVPTDKPQQAYEMLMHFVRNESYPRRID